MKNENTGAPTTAKKPKPANKYVDGRVKKKHAPRLLDDRYILPIVEKLRPMDTDALRQKLKELQAQIRLARQQAVAVQRLLSERDLAEVAIVWSQTPEGRQSLRMAEQLKLQETPPKP